MIASGLRNTVPGFVAVAMALTAPCALGVEPVRFAGVLVGKVTDASGVAQMGAAILLYNRFDRLVSRAVTGAEGGFSFDGLLPDLYSVHVTMPSFVPAIRKNISIQPGMRSFLNINLSSLFASVELVQMPPGQRAVMSDEWKWVLRSAAATRPVLRFVPGLPQVDISDPNRPRRPLDGVFSDTRGLFRVSSGDTGVLAHVGSQADLGTAFAVATTVFGSNLVSVSGNFGYASNSGVPTAGFSTSLTRSGASGFSPSVNLTMRQVYLPAAVGMGITTARASNMPTLQTATLTFHEKQTLGDTVQLQYGASLESVSYLRRLNYVSPFARMRWGTAEGGAIEAAYSSGAPATELILDSGAPDAEIQHQLNTLSVFPRVSLREGSAQVQRTENYELGYRREVKGRVVAVSGYRETIANAALMMSASGALYPGLELLPDLASNSFFYNAGRFRRLGANAAVTEKISETFAVTLAYGYAGAIQTGPVMLDDPANLRRALRRAWRHSGTVRVTGRAPVTGTRYTASYQATDYSVLHPVHLSLTQRSTLEPGLNVYLKQPIPSLSVMRGRLEASAELRNALAQGYLPMGGRVVLIQSPRAVRGGLSLIF